MGGDSSAFNTIKNVAGYGVGTAAALMSIKSGGLGNYLMNRQRLMQDPSFRASMEGSPFTAGMFGISGTTGPAPAAPGALPAAAAGGVAQPGDFVGPPAPGQPVAAPQLPAVTAQNIPGYEPGTPRSWHPLFSPYAPETALAEQARVATLQGIGSSDDVIRTQSKLAAGIPVGQDELKTAVNSARKLIVQAGPGSSVVFRTPGGNVTVGSPYMAGQYEDPAAVVEASRVTGRPVMPGPGGRLELAPDLPQDTYRDKATADGVVATRNQGIAPGTPGWRAVPTEGGFWKVVPPPSAEEQKPATPPAGPVRGAARTAPTPPRVAAPAPEQPAAGAPSPPAPRRAAPRPAAPAPPPPPSPPSPAGPTFNPDETVPHTTIPAPEPAYPSAAPSEEKVGYPSAAPQPAPVRPAPAILNLEEPPPPVAVQPPAPPVAPALVERATPPAPALVMPGREVAPGTPAGTPGPVLQTRTYEWKGGSATYAAPGYEGADTEARKRLAGITDPRIDSPEKAKNLLDDERARAVQKDIDNADVTRLQRGMTETERAAEARLMTMKRAMDDFEHDYPSAEKRAQFLGTVTWPWQTALDKLGWQGAKAIDDFRAAIGLFSKESLTDEKGKPLNPDLAGVASLAPSERDTATRFESQYQQMRDEVLDELAIRSWLRTQPSGSVDATAYNRKLEQLQVDRAQRRVDALTPAPQAAAPPPSAPPAGTAEAAPPPPAPATPPWTPNWIH